MSDYIPLEFIVDVLLRMPAKSLLRFSCASKSWCSLISSPKFILMYTQFTSTTNKNKDAKIMIRYYSRTYGKEVFTLLSDHDMPFGDNQMLDCPVRSSSGYLLNFAASCNGLVCLIDDNAGIPGSFNCVPPKPKPIVLWNPSLGKTMALPLRSNWRRLVLGLGFDSNSFDYKVVRIEFLNDAIIAVDIFALSENYWRSFNSNLPSYDFLKSPPAFVNGHIHWIGHYIREREATTHRSFVVATFDVGNEVFRDLEIPNEIAREGFLSVDKLSLAVHNQSLTLIQYDGYRPQFVGCCIWMMNQYGMAESWTKMYTVYPYDGFLRTLRMRTNGKVLLVTNNGELVSFDHESTSVSNLRVYGESFSFLADTYMESLVLWKEFNKLLGQASSSNATSHDNT